MSVKEVLKRVAVETAENRSLYRVMRSGHHLDHL